MEVCVCVSHLYKYRGAADSLAFFGLKPAFSRPQSDAFVKKYKWRKIEVAGLQTQERNLFM